MLIGYANYNNNSGLSCHDFGHCFEWSFSTGYTCNGHTVARSKEDFTSYVLRFLDTDLLAADTDLLEYIGGKA